MTRSHFVKHARRADKDAGIKKGDSYYWWKFRHSGKYKSKTPPKPSQLTQSDFWGSVLAAFEQFDDLSTSMSMEDIKGVQDNVVSELEGIIDETQGKVDNMPDSLQQGPTGELLNERVSGLGETKDEVEAVDCDLDEEDKTAEEIEEQRQGVIDELQGISYQGE